MSKPTVTTCFRKIAALKKEIRVIQGGSSAGKSWAILQILMYLAMNKETSLVISVVGKTLPQVKKGVMRDFETILKNAGTFNKWDHNKTDNIYSFGGNMIEFFGADDADKLRGSRRDILFMNEANSMNLEVFQQLNMRTKKFCFIDFNPSSEFWVHTELVGQKNVDYIIVNYRDNEFLDKKIIREIESWEEKAETSKYWLNWWNVYGLGKTGRVEGVVFSDWDTLPFIPKEAEYLGSGLDFGFSNDSTACIAVYKYDGYLLLHQLIFETGLSNQKIYLKLKNTDAATGVIYADSAEPKSIADLKGYGLAVLPVSKGPDSIKWGLGLMQQHNILITESSTELIDNFTKYSWLKDKNGETINVPQDANNDGIDATRYLFMMRLSNQNNHFNLKWNKSKWVA